MHQPKLLLCIAVCLAAHAAAQSGLNLEEEWKRYWDAINSIQVNGESLGDLTKKMQHYTFIIPPYALKRGFIYKGQSARLRRVAKDLLEGAKPVKVGVVGGSISHGHGASHKGITDWPSVFNAWLTGAFSNAAPVRNGCIPGTPSGYMVVCLDMSVDQDVDLVFSEYVLNDGAVTRVDNSKTMDVERLIRRVQVLPHAPAMVNLQVMSHGMAFEYMKPRATGEHWGPFHRTGEDVYGSLAQYYDVQWLSFRTTLYRFCHFEKKMELTSVFIEDGIHPNDFGHKIMADLAVWMVMQAVIDVLLYPFDEADAESVSATLPPPMYPGNLVPSSPMCVHNEHVKKLVLNHSGFEYMAEGSRLDKKGYVATTPGSTIFLKVDTSRLAHGDVQVELGYLRSYEKMGKALAQCVSGCSCVEKEVDAHQTARESQTYLAVLKATQHRECIVKLTVLEGSSSPDGGTKFKLNGVIISDQPNPSVGEKIGAQYLTDGGFAGGTYLHD